MSFRVVLELSSAIVGSKVAFVRRMSAGAVNVVFLPGSTTQLLQRVIRTRNSVSTCNKSSPDSKCGTHRVKRVVRKQSKEEREQTKGKKSKI